MGEYIDITARCKDAEEPSVESEVSDGN